MLQLNQSLVSLGLVSIQFSWLLIKLMFSPEGGMLKLEFIGHPMDREGIQLNLLRDFLSAHKLVSSCPLSTPLTNILELKLRTDCREYSDVDEVKRVATKYSSFTSFPLMCDNGKVIFSGVHQ